MRPPKIVEKTLTTIEQLRALPTNIGPCISIYLSPYTSGGRPVSFLPQLHEVIKAAGQALASTSLAQNQQERLLQPLRDFANQEHETTHDSLVIFCADNLLEAFRIHSRLPESMHIANNFFIKPLITAVGHIHEFDILALSQKHVRLFRCTDQSVTPVPLPAGFPKSVQEAEALDIPDHVLEARSAAGSSSGTTGRIHFGTDTLREKTNRYLHDFFKIIDREINHLLLEKQQPLLVAGTDRELALYRRVSTYPYLLDAGITCSPEHLTEAELHKRALEALKAQDIRDEEQLLLHLTEKAPVRTAPTDLSAILVAARSGQIDHLFLSGKDSTTVDDETVNLIALETIRHRGQISTFRYIDLPSGGALAVTFRYQNPEQLKST